MSRTGIIIEYALVATIIAVVALFAAWSLEHYNRSRTCERTDYPAACHGVFDAGRGIAAAVAAGNAR